MYFFIYMIFETRLIFINNNTNNNIEYINRWIHLLIKKYTNLVINFGTKKMVQT